MKSKLWMVAGGTVGAVAGFFLTPRPHVFGRSPDAGDMLYNMFEGGSGIAKQVALQTWTYVAVGLALGAFLTLLALRRSAAS